MSTHRFASFSVSLIALTTTLSTLSCTTEAPPATGAAEQEVINAPLPDPLNLTLNGKTSVTIGPFTQVSGDVAASGPKGSVLFDVASSQYYYYGYGGNVLASTVDVNIQASVGHIYGNLITVDGSAGSQTLGLDPAALPPIPAGTAAAPGTTNVSVPANQARQLCPGQYGAISLAAGATLNLNGGVYDLTKLTLADGAKLEPSEPVVLLISGNMTTGTGAFVGPYPDVVNPITAGDIRIEAGGNITIGDSTQVRAHLLAPTGKLTTGKSTNLTGAGWAKIINIGPQSNVIGEGTFSAVAPSVPPPCNDNNACTADTCVGGGTAFGSCRNAPVPSGTSCADGNLCNGAETCNGAGTCEPGTPLAAGASCADGNACNGAETCNGSGTCEPGTPPVVSDDNSCTTDSCDPTAGVSHVALPDGSTCSGIGVCEAGTCSVQGAVYSADFFQFGDTTNQCNSWNDFLNNQVVDNSYSRVTMSGTFDLTGITCNDPASATQICQAIHQGNSASVSCGGHTWNVGQCGGTELSIDIGTCFCSFGAEHTVRPCTGFDDWGGVNTETCDGPSQTMTVACQ